MSSSDINFVEGEGVSIQVSNSIGGGGVDVEIATTLDTTGDPADDTAVWMPLVDSDGTVVLDDTGLIPTLIPLT